MPYKVVAEFKDWPVADQPIDDPALSAEAEDVVNYISGCIVPNSFSATTQPTPASDKFSGSSNLVTVNPFAIDPSDCPVKYECTSVVGPVELDCDSPLIDFTSCEDPENCDTPTTVDMICGENDYMSGDCIPGTYCV